MFGYARICIESFSLRCSQLRDVLRIFQSVSTIIYQKKKESGKEYSSRMQESPSAPVESILRDRPSVRPSVPRRFILGAPREAGGAVPLFWTDLNFLFSARSSLFRSFLYRRSSPIHGININATALLSRLRSHRPCSRYN